MGISDQPVGDGSTRQTENQVQRAYEAPVLVDYGSVQDRVQAATSGTEDGGAGYS